MSRTAFIIGARGFLGSNTVCSFLEGGWTVHCFGPAMEPNMLAGLEDRIVEIEGSVEDDSAMARAMKDCGADVVITFAAFAAGSGGLARSGEQNADRAFDINVTGLRRTFDATLAAGVGRVLWSSSTTLYGPSDRYPEQPIDETAEARPQGVYGLTKTMGEQLSVFYRDRHGLETVAVRLPLIIGPGLWYKGAAAPLLEMFRQAAPGRHHRLEGPTAKFDLMYVTDCAEALRAIAGHEGMVPERLNINGFTTSFAELARAVEAAVPGYDVEVSEAAPAVVYPLIRAERVEAEIGYRPRFDLEATVRDFIRREQGQHA